MPCVNHHILSSLTPYGMGTPEHDGITANRLLRCLHLQGEHECRQEIEVARSSEELYSWPNLEHATTDNIVQVLNQKALPYSEWLDSDEEALPSLEDVTKELPQDEILLENYIIYDDPDDDGGRVDWHGELVTNGKPHDQKSYISILGANLKFPFRVITQVRVKMVRNVLKNFCVYCHKLFCEIHQCTPIRIEDHGAGAFIQVKDPLVLAALLEPTLDGRSIRDVLYNRLLEIHECDSESYEYDDNSELVRIAWMPPWSSPRCLCCGQKKRIQPSKKVNKTYYFRDVTHFKDWKEDHAEELMGLQDEMQEHDMADISYIVTFENDLWKLPGICRCCGRTSSCPNFQRVTLEPLGDALLEFSCKEDKDSWLAAHPETIVIKSKLKSRKWRFGPSKVYELLRVCQVFEEYPNLETFFCKQHVIPAFNGLPSKSIGQHIQNTKTIEREVLFCEDKFRVMKPKGMILRSDQGGLSTPDGRLQRGSLVEKGTILAKADDSTQMEVLLEGVFVLSWESSGDAILSRQPLLGSKIIRDSTGEIVSHEGREKAVTERSIAWQKIKAEAKIIECMYISEFHKQVKNDDDDAVIPQSAFEVNYMHEQQKDETAKVGSTRMQLEIGADVFKVDSDKVNMAISSANALGMGQLYEFPQCEGVDALQQEMYNPLSPQIRSLLARTLNGPRIWRNAFYLKSKAGKYINLSKPLELGERDDANQSYNHVICKYLSLRGETNNGENFEENLLQLRRMGERDKEMGCFVLSRISAEAVDQGAAKNELKYEIRLRHCLDYCRKREIIYLYGGTDTGDITEATRNPTVHKPSTHALETTVQDGEYRGAKIPSSTLGKFGGDHDGDQIGTRVTINRKSKEIQDQTLTPSKHLINPMNQIEGGLTKNAKDAWERIINKCTVLKTKDILNILSAAGRAGSLIPPPEQRRKARYLKGDCVRLVKNYYDENMYLEVIKGVSSDCSILRVEEFTLKDGTWEKKEKDEAKENVWRGELTIEDILGCFVNDLFTTKSHFILEDGRIIWRGGEPLLCAGIFSFRQARASQITKGKKSALQAWEILVLGVHLVYIIDLIMTPPASPTNMEKRELRRLKNLNSLSDHNDELYAWICMETFEDLSEDDKYYVQHGRYSFSWSSSPPPPLRINKRRRSGPVGTHSQLQIKARYEHEDISDDRYSNFTFKNKKTKHIHFNAWRSELLNMLQAQQRETKYKAILRSDEWNFRLRNNIWVCAWVRLCIRACNLSNMPEGCNSRIEEITRKMARVDASSDTAAFFVERIQRSYSKLSPILMSQSTEARSEKEIRLTETGVDASQNIVRMATPPPLPRPADAAINLNNRSLSALNNMLTEDYLRGHALCEPCWSCPTCVQNAVSTNKVEKGSKRLKISTDTSEGSVTFSRGTDRYQIKTLQGRLTTVHIIDWDTYQILFKCTMQSTTQFEACVRYFFHGSSTSSSPLPMYQICFMPKRPSEKNPTPRGRYLDVSETSECLRKRLSVVEWMAGFESLKIGIRYKGTAEFPKRGLNRAPLKWSRDRGLLGTYDGLPVTTSVETGEITDTYYSAPAGSVEGIIGNFPYAPSAWKMSPDSKKAYPDEANKRYRAWWDDFTKQTPDDRWFYWSLVRLDRSSLSETKTASKSKKYAFYDKLH